MCETNKPAGSGFGGGSGGGGGGADDDDSDDDDLERRFNVIYVT